MELSPKEARPEEWIGEMHLFVAVAQAKSFTRAAKHLGMPYSTLSRRIALLERALGFRLFTRTTRHVELTDEGVEYLDRVEKVVADAVAIHEELRHRRGQPSGLLRVTIPEVMALHEASAWFAEFVARYPNVRLQIDTAPEHADLIRDGFDVCIAHWPVENPSYVKRTLMSFKRGLFASPEYVRAHGLPLRPEELAAHQCICATDSRDGSAVWKLSRTEEMRSVKVSGHVTSLSQILAIDLAKAGLGICAAMPQPSQDVIDRGGLIPVLPDWEVDPLEISMLLPNRLVPAKARAFVDFFAAKYKQIALDYERA